MKKGIKIVGIIISILGFFVLVGFLLTTIRVEIFRYDSEDKQYSVIVKGNLLDKKINLSSIGMLLNLDEGGMKDGEILVVDNVENKVIKQSQFPLRAHVEFKTDSVYIYYSEWYYGVALPRSIRE